MPTFELSIEKRIKSFINQSSYALSLLWIRYISRGSTSKPNSVCTCLWCPLLDVYRSIWQTM